MGFSVIEFIVTIFLFSLISAGMMATFSQALRVWRITQNFSALDIDLSLEKMKDDLRNVAFGNNSFRGSEESFQMMRNEIVPGLKQAKELSLPAQIEYKLDPSIHGISRKLIPGSSLFGGKNKKPVMRTMGSQMERMTFRYYAFDPQVKGYRFVKEWKSQGCAPQAVEVNITYGKLQKFQTITRMMEIPVGGCRV